jgi:hypothetical protein
MRPDEAGPPESYLIIVACEKFKKNNPNHNFIGVSCFLLSNLTGMSPAHHRNIIGTYVGGIL